MARPRNKYGGRFKLTLAFVGISFLGYGSIARAIDLVVGVENLAYMPYYAVEKGKYRGFARELFDKFAADQGHKVIYRPLPVERLYRYLLDGRIDFKFPDNPEWRNELKSGVSMHYSDGVVPFQDGVFVRPERLDQPAAEIKTIGTIRGFAPWPLMSQVKDGSIRVVEQNRIAGLLRQTIESRLDGVYINAAVARYHLKNNLHQESALVLDERIPNAKSAYHITSLSKPEIILELNQWMLAHKVEMTTLLHKWGIEP